MMSLKKSWLHMMNLQSKFIEDLTYDHSNTLDIMYVFDRLINISLWSLEHSFFNPEESKNLISNIGIRKKLNLDDKVDIHNIGNLLVIPNKLNNSSKPYSS